MPMLVPTVTPADEFSPCSVNAFEDGFGGARRIGRARKPGNDHREFVAAEARDHAVGLEDAFDPLGDRLQHGIAGDVAEQIVDFLEAVEVEEQHGKAAVGAAMRREFGLQLLVEAGAVRQFGQRIVMGEEMDILFGLLALADIADGKHLVRPAGIDDAALDQLHRDDAAVGGDSATSHGLARRLGELVERDAPERKTPASGRPPERLRRRQGR